MVTLFFFFFLIHLKPRASFTRERPNFLEDVLIHSKLTWLGQVWNNLAEADLTYFKRNVLIEDRWLTPDRPDFYSRSIVLHSRLMVRLTRGRFDLPADLSYMRPIRLRGLAEFLQSDLAHSRMTWLHRNRLYSLVSWPSWLYTELWRPRGHELFTCGLTLTTPKPNHLNRSLP